jgi:hypothetical protein
MSKDNKDLSREKDRLAKSNIQKAATDEQVALAREKDRRAKSYI